MFIIYFRLIINPRWISVFSPWNSVISQCGNRPHPCLPAGRPLPLLPGEKGCKRMIFTDIAPLPWERGWGEAERKKPLTIGREVKEGLG